MKCTGRILALMAYIGMTLAAADPALSAEPRKPSACPSLEGEWTGDFDGAFEGQWYATFTQDSGTVQASASITLDSGQRLDAVGSAGVKCEGSKTTIAGSGSAGNKSGAFSGISDAPGKKLSGTWWSDNLFGTWRGERMTPGR